MTRFSAIPPLWQIFPNLWEYLNVLLVLGKVLNPLWHIFYAFEQIFIACKWPNIEKTIWSSGHTVWRDECNE